MDKNKKQQQLEQFKADDTNKPMTTNQGLKVSEDEFSLKAGERGPTLIEDFHFREKMTHFDHERIPERIVHARGYAAHGEFELTHSLAEFTKAKFLQDIGKKTPVFVRFSTVAGSRGSGELARDARGFATKFYTEEGNYDLVANNIPVFFIQDAIKFPDLIHAVKPEPHNEIPQAQSAHDTFWDFVGHNQETAHMVLWHLSDRAIPRSFRMMEGFGVNTFRLVNDKGESHFVKFHWKPVLGVHSVVWDEAQKINGKDPDFHRRDLYDAIEMGDFPEYEFGVQLIPEADEFKYDFDILDPTKLWPEELVPVQIVGKMTLNRNVDNVFAETEQVAFHPGHVVPGIDFSNDPLLQGRLFSYTDTQLLRLGGPNFHELPINRPVCPFANNQRDGFSRQTINVGRVSYHKNGLAHNTPTPVAPENGGYEHYAEKIDARKVRARSQSFEDHFSQATLFYQSLSAVEQDHIKEALCFELGKCEHQSVQQLVINMYNNVNHDLAATAAKYLGLEIPTPVEIATVTPSPALSQENTAKKPDTRKIGVIVADGFSDELFSIASKLKEQPVVVEFISSHHGKVTGENGQTLPIKETFLTTDAVLYDAICVLSVDEKNDLFVKKTSDFVTEAFKHFKPIGALTNGTSLLDGIKIDGPGVIKGNTGDFVKDYLDLVTQARFWSRKA